MESKHNETNVRLSPALCPAECVSIDFFLIKLNIN